MNMREIVVTSAFIGGIVGAWIGTQGVDSLWKMYSYKKLPAACTEASGRWFSDPSGGGSCEWDREILDDGFAPDQQKDSEWCMKHKGSLWIPWGANSRMLMDICEFF